MINTLVVLFTSFFGGTIGVYLSALMQMRLAGQNHARAMEILDRQNGQQLELARRQDKRDLRDAEVVRLRELYTGLAVLLGDILSIVHALHPTPFFGENAEGAARRHAVGVEKIGTLDEKILRASSFLIGLTLNASGNQALESAHDLLRRTAYYAVAWSENQREPDAKHDSILIPFLTIFDKEHAAILLRMREHLATYQEPI